MTINSLLSESQQNKIVEIIKKQCRKYQNFMKQKQILFYDPYTSMRRKYDLTSAVISGFSPDSFNVEELSVQDLNYGLNNKLCQPELRSQNGIFHIYSNGSDLKGQKIKERCREYNENLREYPVFFVIVFSAETDAKLQKVEIKLFNSDANIIESYTIYKKEKLSVASA